MAKFKQKGIATIIVVGGIMAVCLIAGLVSDHYLAPDNMIEQGAEEVMDDLIEDELHLPEGSVKIDLSPDSKKS